MKILSSFTLIIAYFSTSAHASYCGQAGVPFSLEALPNGQPVLGCARPTCFGWNANGTRSADVAQFYTIGKKPDGYFRKTDFKGPIVKDGAHFVPQFSYCDRGYLSTSCSNTQWVGGIAPLGMVNASTGFQLMCCTYQKLVNATDDSQAEVRGGQTVVGGEVKDGNGKQVAFEYIANIERSFDTKGAVYKVTIRRFTCPGEVEPVTAPPQTSTEPSTTAPAQPSQQLQSLPQESHLKPNFDSAKFDLPKDLPQEESSKVEEFKGRKAAGEKTYANLDGSSVSGQAQPQPVNGPFPEGGQAQIPNQIPAQQQVQNVPQYTRVAPQLYQVSQQTYLAQPQGSIPGSGVYQPSLLDPLGIFSPRTVYANSVQAPSTSVQQPQIQQPQGPLVQPIIQRVPTIGQNGQWYAQPGSYAYPQNMAPTIIYPQSTFQFPTAGQTQYVASPQVAQGGGSVFPSYSSSIVQSPYQSVPSVAAQAAPTVQQVSPVKIPSVEDVENSIPPVGREILTHMAHAYLSKRI